MRVPLYTVEPPGGGRLSLLAHPRGGDWLAEEVAALRADGVDVLVSLLTPEEIWELGLRQEGAHCQAQGIHYLAFPIEDCGVPAVRADALAFLEQLHALLRAGQHLAIHCRFGVGRSGLIGSSLLVLSGLPPQRAFALLTAARKHPIPETDEQRAWVIRLAGQTQAESDTSTG